MQEMDCYSAEGSYQCHRCAEHKVDFSSADFRGSVKSTVTRRADIARAASGVDLPETIRGDSTEAVVDWGDFGETNGPVSKSAHYKGAP